jgi:hypothetical protein
MARWHGGVLGGAFNFWRSYASYSCHLKAGMSGVVARMRNAGLSAAFSCWRCARRGAPARRPPPATVHAAFHPPAILQMGRHAHAPQRSAACLSPSSCGLCLASTWPLPGLYLASTGPYWPQPQPQALACQGRKAPHPPHLLTPQGAGRTPPPS